VFKRYHSDKNNFQSFYLQDGGKNQLEQNYVTVTLCIFQTWVHETPQHPIAFAEFTAINKLCRGMHKRPQIITFGRYQQSI